MRLVYVSTAVLPSLSNNDIAAFDARNRAQGITGTLLFLEATGTYVQTLEGPVEDVTRLWDTLSIDHRHHSVRVVYTETSVGTWRSCLRYVAVPRVQPNPTVVVWALDDVALVRKLTTRLLSSLVGNIQYAVHGATDDEIQGFARNVMLAVPPVHVVILDNVLSSPTHSAPTIYGLDVAQELMTSGFTGTIIMSSANTLVHPFVDMPKDMSFVLKRQLLATILSSFV
jgi:hypothetical protein